MQQDGTTVLILIGAAIVGGWILLKMVMGFVKVLAMGVILIACVAMFVPGIREPLLNKLSSGARTQSALAADKTCKAEGLTPAQCKKAKRELASQINRHCFGSEHDWRECNALMKRSMQWVNMLCMKRARIAEDCVNAVRDRLREKSS